MSDLDPDVADQIIAFLQTNWIESCCGVAACTLVLYDHLTTLSREVELIWGRKFNSVTMLFYLNRWVIFMWAIQAVTGFVSLTTSASCIGATLFDEIVDILLYGIWTVFSAVRMYAVSGGNWWLASAAGSLTMVSVGTNAYYSFASTSFQIDTLPVLGVQCDVESNLPNSLVTKLEVVTRVCMIAADILILLVTWSKTYNMRRDASRHNIEVPLATMLIKDGTVYFVMLLGLNVLSIVGYVTEVFLDTSEFFTTPLSSIIISHFLLNLRQVATGSGQGSLEVSRPSFVRSQHDGQGNLQSSGLMFPSFVDNMGESLFHSSDSSNPENTC